MDNTSIISADIVMAACCLVLHVSMMLRFHSRPDLGNFRVVLLALSGFFFLVAWVFAWDAYELWTGAHTGTAYIRWAGAAFGVVTAYVLMSPESFRYYKRVVPPDVCDEHRREIQRLMDRLGEGEK